MKKLTGSILLLALLWSSCSRNAFMSGGPITKRKHMKGWHIELPVASKQHTGQRGNTDQKKFSKIPKRPFKAAGVITTTELIALTEHGGHRPAWRKAKTITGNPFVRKVVVADYTNAAAIAHYQWTDSGSAVIATGAKQARAPGKSQIVALVLVLFVGLLGIHRFYLGYTGIGILQLLTAGGCGIWTLIDLIRIATGDLKPKDGDYEETL